MRMDAETKTGPTGPLNLCSVDMLGFRLVLSSTPIVELNSSYSRYWTGIGTGGDFDRIPQ